MSYGVIIQVLYFLCNKDIYTKIVADTSPIREWVMIERLYLKYE